MNAQATNKPENKGNAKLNPTKPVSKSAAKPNTAKPTTDQEKAINQLRQEIRTLTKTVKEMQQKPDTQTVNIAIPHKLLSRVNLYLLDYAHSTGTTVSLSELICDALDIYLWGDKENQRLEDERERTELEKKKGK
jgi:hypothetical protein